MTKNKYKVEIEDKNIYVVDVYANTLEEAEEIGMREFSMIMKGGMEHYYQTGDGEFNAIETYDVTNTDDPFSPVNEELSINDTQE